VAAGAVRVRFHKPVTNREPRVNRARNPTRTAQEPCLKPRANPAGTRRGPNMKAGVLR
jgi:hypothetical protein